MAIYETLYPQGNFLDIRANAPTSTDYNIQVMEDLVRNLPGGGIRDLLAPATAATLSLPYDAIQAATRTTEDDISRAMETAGMYGPKDIASEAYGLAFGRERPLSSAIERTIGASGPLAERINNLNLFNSAVAAEKPTVPNLSLGYNMPTFDLGTGITNTTAASPFINTADILNQYNVPNLGNRDLVQQIIAENQARTNPFVRPNMLDIAGEIVPGGVTDMNKLPYSGVGDMRYMTPRTIADQNRVLGQTFTEPKKSNGIMDAIMSFVIPGYNFIKNLGSGQPYERYTPGGTIRDGIYSIGGVNVPVSSYGGDFYDPTTGLNRFDRARQTYEQTGKVTDLFKSSRTGKEFFEKMRDKKAAERKALEETAAAKLKYKTYTSGGGGGGIGSSYGGAASPGSKGPGGSDEMGSF